MIRFGFLALFGAFAIAAPLVMGPAAAAEASPELIEKGGYLVRAGGCIACHTDFRNKGPELAGGRGLETPFGMFYSPNITADPETGIGRWSDADFIRALKRGERPDGSHYFPVFPYTTYVRLSDEDARAIKAWLFAQPPVRLANKPHDVPPPFSLRFLQAGWKWLFFDNRPFAPEPNRDAAYNRGNYLVNALTHCAECHSPRNPLGGFESGKYLAGTAEGPEGEKAPNITPHKGLGIGTWTKGELVELMKTGTKPDFDNVQGTMGEAVKYSLSYLTDADLEAIATYILAQPPVANKVERRKK